MKDRLFPALPGPVPTCVLMSLPSLVPPCPHSRSGSMSTNTIATPAVRCPISSWATSTTSGSSARTSVVSVTHLVSPRTQLESSSQVRGRAAWLLVPGWGWGGTDLIGASSSLGITLKSLEYREHDFRTAPKFLTPLTDRVVVAGYAAALNCAVRGHPKVPGWGWGSHHTSSASPRPPWWRPSVRRS